MSKPIIVDLVSGFLGAGKTTLISKYAAFRIKQGERVAIIENEFGEMGIDGELLKDAGLSVTEIVNGCICCTMKDDLTTTLELMCNDNPPDRVIIEPTGIFIIDGITEILDSPRIRDTHKLRGVVTVIDALGFTAQQHRYTMFFKRPILFANKLIMSKTVDMETPQILDTIEALREITGDVDIEAKDWDTLTTRDWNNLFAPKPTVCTLDHEHDESCGHDHGHDREHEHDDDTCTLDHEHDESCGHNHNHDHGESSHGGFAGITVPGIRAMSQQELDDILKRIASEEFGDIPRAKGFVPNANGGYWQLDVVGEQIKIKKAAEGEREARVSFIGIGMDKSSLAKLFA